MVPQPAGGRDLSTSVLDWYVDHGRDLGFRRSLDPWSVLVSEVMAQQTQAARAARHWARFMAGYPTPAALARATQADAIRAWRGLGYNRRAIALRLAAIRIVEQHRGRVPDDLEALQALPGIGPYTARAVLAIAFGQPVAALDTNIQRVLDRAIGLPASTRERQVVADALVPPDRPAAWTHALMDLGATICRKRDPRCGDCPLAMQCAFARAGTGSALPRPNPDRRPRTPRFESTTRWLRGRILDRLRDAHDGDWVEFDADIGGHASHQVQTAVAALAVQGLLETDAAAPWRARLPR